MNIPDLKKAIMAHAVASWAELQATYNCGELPPINFVLKATNSAGFAMYKGAIELNLAYAASEGMRAFAPTIDHELAHIVQFRCFPNAKQAHGVEFRCILDSLFADNSTHHNYDVRKAASTAKQLKNAFDLDSI